MKSLKELYESKKNVRYCDIPEDWIERFRSFMYGQTITKEEGEFVAYHHDFTRWYQMNKQSIEREEKINDILDS